MTSRRRDDSSSGNTPAQPNVFYPGTTDISQAQSIRLRAGEERSGVDFRLVSMPGGRVKGKVVGVDGSRWEF